MPFSEFRFLNGSSNPQTADATVVDTTMGMPTTLAAPISQPEQKVHAPDPAPAPPPPPNVNQVSAANVSSTIGPLALNVPLNAPPGEHFLHVTTVLTDGIPGEPTMAVIYGCTNTCKVISAPLH